MRRVPFIAQMAAEDCGPTCLAMILGAHGHHASLAEVRDKCGAGRSGTTAYDLIMAAKTFGLEGGGMAQVEPSDVSGLLQDGPVILHWGLGHMVVCDGANRGGLRILDPAEGLREAGWAEADKKMSGVVLCFKKTGTFVSRAPERSPLATYLQEIISERMAFGVLVAAGILSQAFVVLPALAVGVALDQCAGSPSLAALAGIAGLGLAALVGSLIDMGRGILAAKLAARENERFYARVLERLLQLPLGWLQARGSGEIMVSLTQIQGVLGETASALLGLLTASFSVLACFFVVIFLAPVAAAFSVAAGIVLVLGTQQIAERERVLKRPFFLATGRLGHEAVELARAQQWVEMAGLGGWAKDRLLSRLKAWHGHVLVAGDQAQLSVFQVSALTALLNGGLLGIAGWLGVSGRLTLGQVAVVVALGAVLVGSLGALGGSLRALRGVMNTLDRADDILQAEGEARGEHAGHVDGKVSIRGARFAYWPGAEPVVDQLDLEIGAGEMVGLVGPSGCGKSTLGALIAGVRLPDAGEVLLSGVSTRQWRETALRGQIGYALQSPEVLAGTVRLNLELGRLKSDAALWRVLECVCLDARIRALGGLDGHLDSGGRNLSGGERQRLALARVLVGDPSLLVLDEATSAVDLPVEAEIHRNLRSLSVTRLFITHRRGSLALADRVLEMKGGRFV